VIAVARVAQAAGYAKVKADGKSWLKAHPTAKRPKDLWSPYLPVLADGFSHLCGYAAMLDPTGGTVDHYLSWKNHPAQAYDWTNFRFVSSVLNSSKRNADDAVLDPYVVRNGWFEIILPSLQMRVTDRCPAAHREAAVFTLKRLKLGNGEKIVRWRRHFYARFQAGQLTLDGLRGVAPLVADAVERQLRTAARKSAASRRRKRNTKRRRA
jgi:hypothetical protein